MPKIYDNIERKFSEGISEHIKVAKRVDYCVGYFNVRGWKTVCDQIDNLTGMDIKENGATVKRYCRLLVGMVKPPYETLVESYNPDGEIIDNEKASKMKYKLAEEFKKQLELGSPTNEDENTIKKLLSQLKSGKVVVKLFLEYQLHAKLYLAYTSMPITEKTALIGSSNFTISGFHSQGELNIDVLDQDAAQKLSDWFDQRWNSRWCIDITKELIEIIENSWARQDDLSPYLVYMKMAYHLSQEARAGISDFKLPREFKTALLDYQQKAVLIAAQHLHKRNGVIIGDVVGLGKTITACAVAKIMEDDLLLNTLILCPKNLVEMWEEYVEKYGLHAHVLSHSMIMSDLENLKRYRLVIIDESHNFRNSENKTYKKVKGYIDENESKVILLSATPYNKSYKDLANQLKLFISDDYDLGMSPEKYIESIGGPVQFHMKHDNIPIHSIAAFEKSQHPDDWRELMRLYLVRRTRSFIKNNYAFTDNKSDRKYLLFESGERSYFPDRLPRKITFPLTIDDVDDQYAKLYDDEIVDIINDLNLPRYSMLDYVKDTTDFKLSSDEKRIIDNLSRAGHRTRGFCRTNLFKRLESSGYSFMLSLERLIIRNYIVEYAASHNKPIPIGGNDTSVEMNEDFSFEYGDTDFDYVNAQLSYVENFEINKYKTRAEELYHDIFNNQYHRFQWLKPDMFKLSELSNDLSADNKELIKIVKKVPSWDSNKDRKLTALYNLITNKHKDDKILVFTQYSDTADYLQAQLQSRGVNAVEKATGASKHISDIAKRFSPNSNSFGIPRNDEIRVLITTDVLSEGQNLQDAHIIINFDLPWALIRLVQRAGRVDRLGQTSDKIYCYSFLPEDGIENIIGLRNKLKVRIKQNAEVVGSDEVFFDGDPINIADLYSEKAGLLDEDDDTEVDLASYAYQIWKNETDKYPALKQIIPKLSNVVFSTKNNTFSKNNDSIIVYTKTGQGNDILSWVDCRNNVITQSQYTILRAAECEHDIKPQERIENHHDVVQNAVKKISLDEYSGMGTLGRKTGIRYKSYMKISRFVEQISKNSKVPDDYKKVLDDIYKFPLCESARDVLSRQLKTEVSDKEFTEAAIVLRNENRLCITDDDTLEFRPIQIICSLGLRKVD